TSIALTSTSIEFIKAVFPNDKVIVISEKIYFRFGKLKCRVKMTNESGDMLCMGEIAGMII
ncbi:MAG: 3-hydroxyacyl-[acyl-carrier-protein] dehydratase, partial [Flavobacterium sp.]